MAGTAITVNTAKSLGNQLSATINQMRYIRSSMQDTQKLMENMRTVAPADYTLLETQYGLSNGGANLLTQITNFNTQIANSTAFNLLCDNVVPLN